MRTIPSLSAIFSDFLSGADGAAVRCATIASAGFPVGDTMLQSNLPWPVSLKDLRERFGFRDLTLINDFAAIAYGTQFLSPSDTTLLSGAGTKRGAGPTLVMGPGTGLGAAVLVPRDDHPMVLSTEAGQVAFAPTTDLEIEILKVLRSRMPHVSNENIVSGPGLVNLHTALGVVNSERTLYRTPAEITSAALDDAEPMAKQALDVFCGAMGSVAGLLTLLYGAHGGVFLAGGVLPRIKRLSAQEQLHGALCRDQPDAQPPGTDSGAPHRARPTGCARCGELVCRHASGRVNTPMGITAGELNTHRAVGAAVPAGRNSYW